MRRRDREVIDLAKIEEIIRSCDCCRIAFADKKGAYVVPLNFGYKDGVFYFHGAKEGRKMDLIREKGYAGFELDTAHSLKKDDKACGYTFLYQSVIGEGKMSIAEDLKEKKEGLMIIMEHYSGKYQWDFEESILERTCIFKLEAEKMSCKEHV